MGRKQLFTRENAWERLTRHAVRLPNGCLDYKPHGNQLHYPPFVLESGKRSIPAHRAAWLAQRGDIPQGKFVCHRCDRRRCIEPEHLFLGTAQENAADMVRKGRHGPGYIDDVRQELLAFYPEHAVQGERDYFPSPPTCMVLRNFVIPEFLYEPMRALAAKSGRSKNITLIQLALYALRVHEERQRRNRGRKSK